MNTLWTFGESFTYGYGCTLNVKQHITFIGFDEDLDSNTYIEYSKYKSKVEDDIWPVLVSNLLNMNLKNLGVNGYCNNLIIDSIIDNYNDIKEGDVVIIGKTSFGRTNIPYGDNLLHAPQHRHGYHFRKLYPDFDELDSEVRETIINFQYHFSDNVYYQNQQDKRIQFLVDRLCSEKKVKKCVIWDGLSRKGINTIIQDTSGKIDDRHFSWKGHSQFTRYIYSRITSMESTKSLL
tara:strand:+ start:4806 stop:5510 length:705 start_codon:yes stop_codon:yes gene_type:complete